MICNSMLRSVTIGNKRRPMGGWVFLSALLVLLVAGKLIFAFLLVAVRRKKGIKLYTLTQKADFLLKESNKL